MERHFNLSSTEVRNDLLVPGSLRDILSDITPDTRNLHGAKLQSPSFLSALEARPHTPVYTMHKYFARRPWNIFQALIAQYSSPGEIILDPFCGGGTTVVESLKLRRRAVGVDVNPLASYVTEMECRQTRPDIIQDAFDLVRKRVRKQICSLYSARCESCGSTAIADWIQWNEQTKKILSLKVDCPTCGASRVRCPTIGDIRLAERIRRRFSRLMSRKGLWFPTTPIPRGDKTASLRNQNVHRFDELFTKRNLLALSLLLAEINAIPDKEAKSFLRFAFSGSLKWSSRQSHLRGKIVEGWALHAYWVYPKSLEINVWRTFERRIAAILRGKSYSGRYIGDFCKLGSNFNELLRGTASCLLLNKSSTRLPIPDSSVDAIVTDPPYGANVNYSELSDFWHVWLKNGETIDKKNEVIINKTQGKGLPDYALLLQAVFKECYRVLKVNHLLVCTFNSKDLRVVMNFIIAARRAGFALHPEGLTYQRPIRAYMTTYHAMQIDAFVGDFVFAFVKERAQILKVEKDDELKLVNQKMAMLISKLVKAGKSEVEVREHAYRIMIPFVAKFADIDVSICMAAVEFFENTMKDQDRYFASLRRRRKNSRSLSFLNRQKL